MTSELAIAIHTLVFLNHKGDCQSSEKIAENVCTNPVCIRRILSKLKKADLIGTKEGIEGGAYFIREPEAVSLDMVLAALHETPISVSKRTGDLDMECLIASNMAFVMDEIYEKMNKGCIQKLREITIRDIDERIFGRKQQDGKEDSKI